MLTAGEQSREAVLALPLSRLLVRMVRIPADADALAVCSAALKEISPFPDDPMTVSSETVRENEQGRVVIAAALPENAADDICEALDAKKLNVTRVDVLALGQLRGLWNALNTGDGSRRLVLMKSVDCLSLIVLDGDQPSAIRALTDESDLRREIMLSLLEAEDFGGSRGLTEIVSVGGLDASSLSSFAPVRTLEVGGDAALVGVAERSADPSSLNALPESWAEVLEETRFKSMLTKRVSVAGVIWALVMAILFGVPLVYGYLTDRQKALFRQQSNRYNEVVAMREKVMLIKKYADPARSSLKILKVVSDRLPEGITLTSWNYNRDEGVKLSAEADTASLVYEFKNAMAELAFGENNEGDLVFPKVNLIGPSAVKDGRQKFELELGFVAAEEEVPQ